jgi:hypothetical protein
VAAALNNEYLVKNEGGGASHINNGIYVLTVVGDGGTAWELTRRDDLTGGDSAAGAFVHIEQGTALADATFRCINNVGSDVVNTDALEWVYWGQTVDHSQLKNLNWDVAGHVINDDVDMNGNNLTEVGSVVGTAADAKVESDVGDVILKVGDNAGVKGVNVKDSDDATVFFINSDGNVTIGQAVQKGTSFPSSPTDGDLFNRTDLDMVFRYDGGRSKWLSEHSETFVCGRGSVLAVADVYAGIGSAVMSSASGLRMPRNGTIVAVTVENQNTVTRTIDYRVNNSAVNRVQLALTAAKGGKDTSANQDFSADDLLQVLALAAAGNGMTDLIATIEVKWRA